MSSNQHQATNAQVTPLVKKDVKKENRTLPSAKQKRGNLSSPAANKSSWKEWSALKYVIL
ncbi:hypothetical protein D9M68_540640 [compost metagenome]